MVVQVLMLLAHHVWALIEFLTLHFLLAWLQHQLASEEGRESRVVSSTLCDMGRQKAEQHPR